MVPFAEWSAEDMEADFWERRPVGRAYQTLQQDATLYLTYWQGQVGWQTCSAMFVSVMKKQEQDIAEGGLVPTGKPEPPAGPTPNMQWNDGKKSQWVKRDPYKKKGGLHAF